MRRLLLLLLIGSIISASTLAASPAAPAAPDAAKLVRDGRDLYRHGNLGEALIKFEEAAAHGAQGGELFYQMGYCYKTVRQDLDKSREFMTKAIPLLQAMPENDLSRYYYLSAVSMENGSDTAAGQENARKGVALIEKGTVATPKDGEGLFQVGRLYSLAGQADKAATFNEKAAAVLEAEKSPNRQYLLNCYQSLAQYYFSKQDYPKSAHWYQRLLKLDPDRRQERTSASFMLMKAGDYQGAIDLLRGFTDDEMVTQSNYVIMVLTRYIALGTPPIDPNSMKLDDKGLQDAILASAKKLSEIRQKDEAASKSSEEEDIPAKIITTKSGKKMKIYTYIEPPTEEVIPKDPNHPTPEEQQRMIGITYPTRNAPPPPSPERVAAEKEFFPLMVEYVRRGHLLQDFAMSQGLTSLIFR